MVIKMNQYTTEQFEKDLTEIGLSFTKQQIDQFLEYYELLVEWNSFMNLTAITEYDEVCKKHFVDSVSLSKAVDLTKPLSVIDIGTGAGFPGIPLKIMFPNLKITLLDSLGKRVKFLNEVIQRLDLHNIEAIHGRAEDYAKPGLLREQFDISVSRAVANLSTLAEYCLPFVKRDGYFISYKSEKIAEEKLAAEHAISILGGKYEREIDFLLPDSDIYRNFCMIKKIKNTPIKYPRKAGVPSKEPIS